MHREMADYRREVGQRLKALRKSRTWSQDDAADAVGVKEKTWGLWERGVSAPYERNWGRIQAAFSLSDEEVAAIRGTQPDPLGLGQDSAADQILESLAAIRSDIAELTRRLPPEGTVSLSRTARAKGDRKAADQPRTPRRRQAS